MYDSLERPWESGRPQKLEVSSNSRDNTSILRKKSRNGPFRDRSVGILWVSETAFVSALDFSIGGHYSVEVYSRNSVGIDSYLELNAYTIDQFNGNPKEIGFPPVHPAKFLALLSRGLQK
jgi:hypothetical protein